MNDERDFARLPGFRDFAPEELALREHIFAAWRGASRRYGFQEYDGPPLESLDLYTEKSGEEIVTQLYSFVDKGGREVSLRPEMTPSLARILAERSKALPKPIRWFSLPQLFRYERQQRGRLREHFQWNADIVGEAAVGADAEVLAVAVDALRDLGLDAGDVRARVSDRRLLREVLAASGVRDDARQAAYAVIDKVEREPRDRILDRFRDEVGLEGASARRLLEILEAPGLDGVREFLGDRGTVAESLEPLDEYRRLVGALGMGDFLEFDLTIVRGLAYYTGIVFELFDTRGELRAVCGGGRYDRLLELVGGEPLPAVGFGMGDVVLAELLQERGLAPDYERTVDFYVVAITEGQRSLALDVARSLRADGRSVVYSLEEQSVRKQFSAASTEGAREVVVLGPDEVERGRAVVRDMRSGEEREVDLEELRG